MVATYGSASAIEWQRAGCRVLVLRKLEAFASLDPIALERRCKNRGLWIKAGDGQAIPCLS